MLQDGVYIKGLYLQGAGWEQRSSTLKEAEPMQLVCAMPSIHFKPSEARKKSSKGRGGGGGGGRKGMRGRGGGGGVCVWGGCQASVEKKLHPSVDNCCCWVSV